jgi:adenylate cyclase
VLFEGWYLYGRSRFAEGNMAEAGRLFEEAARVRPDDYQAICLAVQTYEKRGDMDYARELAGRAVARCRRNLELHPEDTRAWTLGAGALVSLGEAEEGLRWTERALAIDSEDINVLHNVGCVLAEVGEIDRALDIFEKRFALGKAHKDWIDNDPSFDSIREHPRFKAMLRT